MRWVSLFLVLGLISPRGLQADDGVPPVMTAPPASAAAAATPYVQHVPVDQPASWPAGDWQPLPRTIVDRFLAQPQIPARGALHPEFHLREARYAARLERGVLRGTCEFHVLEGEADEEIVLTPLSLRLTDVRWDETVAVWGTRADGRTVLLRHPTARLGHCEWEAAGRRVFDGWEFVLEIPIAGLSDLQLDLPAEFELHSSAGIVQCSDLTADPTLRRWTVHAGRATSLRLVCAPTIAPVTTQPPLLRESHVATIRGEGLDLVSDFEFVGGNPPSEIQFEIPPELQVVAATVGSDARAPMRIREEGPLRVLTLAWPFAQREPRLRLRSQSVEVGDATRPRPLPLPRPRGTVCTDHQLALYVRPPLELQSFQADGYRLTDRRADAESIESWTFQALRRDPQLSVRLSKPAMELSAQSATWADYRGDVGSIRARIRVQAVRGPTFQIAMTCPAEWEIATIASAPQSSVRVADFHLTDSRQHGLQGFTIELAQPLATGEFADVLIQAVAPIPHWSASTMTPSLRLQEGGRQEGVVAIVAPYAAEIASSQPSLASPPAGPWLDWLEALAGDNRLAEAQLYDLSGVRTDPTTAVFTLESSATDRESMSETPIAASPPASERVSDEGDTPPRFTALQVVTTLAEAGRPEHHHAAEYALAAPFHGRCSFQLSGGAEIELVVDGANVPTVNDGKQWLTPDIVTIRERLVVRYRTPAAAGTLTRAEAIPLPVWPTSPVVPFHWDVRPPATRACNTISIPFARITERAVLPWTMRVLGPLAQRPNVVEMPVGAAGPVSRDASSPVQADHNAQGILQVAAADAPALLVFSTWNPEIADRTAWAVMLLTLCSGVLLRRTRWRWGRPLGPVGLVGLLTATIAAPDDWVRVCGGASAGLILTILVPRRMIVPDSTRRPRSVATRDGSKVRKGLQAAAGAGVLLLAVTLFPLGSTAQEPGAPVVRIERTPDILLPDHDGEPSATAYVTPRWRKSIETWAAQQPAPTTWMIRAASCDVSIEADVQVRAQLEVLVRDVQEPVPVRLPLNGVTFDSEDAIKVDGAVAAIIPAAQGAAVIIMLPPHEHGIEDAESSPGWRRHVVDIQCRVQIEQRPGRQHIEFQLPPAPAIKVRWRAADSILKRLWIGEQDVASSLPLEESIVTQPVGNQPIRASWDVPPLAPEGVVIQAAVPLQIVTVIDAGPLQTEARSRIALPIDPVAQLQTWTIPLRSEAVLRQVTAPPEVRWRWTTGRTGPVVEVVAVEPLTDPPVLEIESVLLDRAQSVPGQPRQLHGLLTLNAPLVEWVSLRPTSGFALSVHRNAVPVAGTPELPETLLPALRDQQFAETQPVYRLDGAQELAWNLTTLPTERRATVDSRLAIDRTLANWSADVVIDVTGSPTPLHRLAVDPNVQVDQVVALLDGVDRLARFVKHGDQIELILARPYAGALRVHLNGSLPVAAEQELTIPRISVVEGSVQTSIDQITNVSGWTAEILRTQGEPLALNNTSLPVVFTDSDPTPPVSFRLLPGNDAAVGESLVQFVRLVPSGWQQRILIDVRPQGTPLKPLVLDLPPHMSQGLRVFPAADARRTSSTEDGRQTYLLTPNRLRGGTYRIVLQANLPEDFDHSVWAYEPLKVNSLPMQRRWLVLPEDFPMRPTSASGTESKSALPSRWDRVVRRSNGQLQFDMAPQAAAWSFTPDGPTKTGVAVPLLESQVWLDGTEGVRGRTHITAVVRRPASLLVEMPAGMAVQDVRLGSQTLEWQFANRQLTFDLPHPLQDPLITVDWRFDQEPQVGQTIELPRLADASGVEHLASVVSGTSSRLELASPSPLLDVQVREMSALLAAAEQQSTRTFALDSPLLESLRRANAGLERALSMTASDPSQRSDYQRLQERWTRVQELIAVESTLPGDAAPEFGRNAAGSSQLLPNSTGGQLAIVDPRSPALRLRANHREQMRPLEMALAALVIGGLWLLQRGARWERFADWLADRPELSSLALGLFWLLGLQPRIIGVALLLVSMALWGRRRQRPPEPADTALVGPGR